jgi:hypothetical protein
MVAVLPTLIAQGQSYHIRVESFGSLVVIGLIVDLAFTTTIGLAIYPKFVTSFARPSLFSLPWKSYVLFGILAYVVGAGAMIVALKVLSEGQVSGSLPAVHPVALAMLYGGSFAITTTILSVLLDWRLQASSIDFHRRRMQDGVAVAGAFAVMTVVINAGWWLLEKHYQLNPVDVPLLRHVVFILLFTAFGFAIGFLIPSTTEAYMKANEILLAPGNDQPPQPDATGRGGRIGQPARGTLA